MRAANVARTFVVAFLLLLIAPIYAEEGRVWRETWRDASPLNVPRAGAAVIANGNTIYALGGVDGKKSLASVEFSSVESDSNLTAWRFTSPLPLPRSFADAVIVGGFIYVVGGAYGDHGKHLLSSVIKAPILSDGALGEWSEEAGLNLPRRCVKLARHGRAIVAIGGFAGALLDSVEVAEVGADGRLSEWRMLDRRLRESRYVHSVKAIGDDVWVMGGHHSQEGSGLVSVERFSLSRLPELASESMPSMNVGRYGFSSFVSANRVFVVGGISGFEYLDTIEMAEIVSNSPSKWRDAGKLPRPLANAGVVFVGDTAFVIGGGSQRDYLRNVSAATISKDGRVGNWMSVQEVSRTREVENQPKESDLPYTGMATDVIRTNSYTYVEIDRRSWLAGPVVDVKIGRRIRFSEGVLMSNFHSSNLNRTFPLIRFVSRLNVEQANE